MVPRALMQPSTLHLPPILLMYSRGLGDISRERISLFIDTRSSTLFNVFPQLCIIEYDPMDSITLRSNGTEKEIMSGGMMSDRISVMTQTLSDTLDSSLA